jgi:hypothetical protein
VQCKVSLYKRLQVWRKVGMRFTRFNGDPRYLG